MYDSKFWKPNLAVTQDCDDTNFANVSPFLEENRQLKMKLAAIELDVAIMADHLSEYILLYHDMRNRCFRVEAQCRELYGRRNSELEKVSKDIGQLPGFSHNHKAGAVILSEKSSQDIKMCDEDVKFRNSSCLQREISSDLEYKPMYRSPEEMMKTRFEILAGLPIPKDIPLDALKPLGIPERFTLHEFLLGSASGSLRNAIPSLSGYCAFTENTTMWCPQREEHGFYLTPLYKCDTGSRSNIIHRWSKVDIKARMPKPTECFFKKDGEWYYTGTYKSLRLEDLTPKEYDNLSQETRNALVRETLAGRKNSTPQVVFETSQLYVAGALKVAVVGIQCIGFNHMLYSVALQQARRFQSRGKELLDSATIL